MALNNLVNSIKDVRRTLKEKSGSLYYASLAYLTMTVMDGISTSLLANMYGTEGEQNKLTKYAMDELGIEAGLIVKGVLISATILGVAYSLNWRNRNSDYAFARNWGTMIVYTITLGRILAVINNFSQYFQ